MKLLNVTLSRQKAIMQPCKNNCISNCYCSNSVVNSSHCKICHFFVPRFSLSHSHCLLVATKLYSRQT